MSWRQSRADSVGGIGNEAFAGCNHLTSATIGNSITSIGSSAFNLCSGLTSITIPGSVTNIGSEAFILCTSLTGVYFQGNAPAYGVDVFTDVTNVTVYYLPGTMGWDSMFADVPAVLWNPQAQTTDGSFGVLNNQFGFNITGTTNIPVVVAACTNLANPVWQPLSTNTLTGGISYFSDPLWTNYPSRFYSLQMP